MEDQGTTYAQRLDHWAEERGGQWRVWSEWRYVDGFTRWRYWHGEVKDSSGNVMAAVEDYRPDKTVNGPNRTARRLWKQLAGESTD